MNDRSIKDQEGMISADFQHQLLLFVAGVAFTAWAGVVAWMGNSVIGSLDKIHDDLKELNTEFQNYKLQDSQERTRLEARLEAIMEDHDEFKAAPR